jgi:sarcosine oxidase
VRVCVIGLGAMGVAATRVLAERGHRVVAIDRHGVANDLGASAHGQRIFRLAHARGDEVRLARRALLHWRELERRDGASLLRATGLLEVGGPHEEIVAALRSEHATVVELDGAEAPDLFPGLAPHHGQPARWQPAAGVLAARDCLLVQADLAARAGAEIASEAAFAVEPASDGVVVRTRLRRIEADVAVIATGPWLNDLLQPLGLEVALRATMSQASLFRGSGWDERPCLVAWDRDGHEAAYGVPVAGSGYKFGLHPATSWTPDDEERRPDHTEALALARRVSEEFVGLGARPLRTERYPWVTTGDGGFVIDRRGPAVVAGGCAGHGFMFSPVLGELIADVVEGGAAPEPFRLDRPELIGVAR